MGEATQPQSLGHQPQVLEHHPLLDGHELRHQRLELLDGQQALVARVVVEVAAARAGEPPEPGGAEPGALVDDEGAGSTVEDLEQTVDVEEGQLADRKEVGRGRVVERPAVDRQVVERPERRLPAAARDPDAAPAIEVDELAAARGRDQLRDLGGGEVARPLEQPGAAVVGHHHRDRVDGVAARRGAPQNAGDDRATPLGAEVEIHRRRSGEAAGGERQERLLALVERQPRLLALVVERAALHAHAAPEPPRTAVAQGVEQRIAANLVRRIGSRHRRLHRSFFGNLPHGARRGGGGEVAHRLETCSATTSGSGIFPPYPMVRREIRADPIVSIDSPFQRGHNCCRPRAGDRRGTK